MFLTHIGACVCPKWRNHTFFSICFTSILFMKRWVNTFLRVLTLTFACTGYFWQTWFFLCTFRFLGRLKGTQVITNFALQIESIALVRVHMLQSFLLVISHLFNKRLLPFILNVFLIILRCWGLVSWFLLLWQRIPFLLHNHVLTYITIYFFIFFFLLIVKAVLMFKPHIKMSIKICNTISILQTWSQLKYSRRFLPNLTFSWLVSGWRFHISLSYHLILIFFWAVERRNCLKLALHLFVTINLCGVWVFLHANILVRNIVVVRVHYLCNSILLFKTLVL